MTPISSIYSYICITRLLSIDRFEWMTILSLKNQNQFILMSNFQQWNWIWWERVRERERERAHSIDIYMKYVIQMKIYLFHSRCLCDVPMCVFSLSATPKTILFSIFFFFSVFCFLLHYSLKIINVFFFLYYFLWSHMWMSFTFIKLATHSK